MKKIITFLFVFVLLATALATSAEAAARVRGYIKKSGTYVAPHYKSNRDSSKFNNWSTKGNSNPFTGKKGYVNPYNYKRR